MKLFLLRFRYWLELLSVPAFLFLIVDMTGHGMMLLIEMFEGGHGHESHAHGESLLSVENVMGFLLGIIFVWLWHRPQLKKWVPCSHDHCHNKISISHTLAIIALCLHFFPEAAIRHELLEGHENEQSVFHWITLGGFLLHFFVDVIIAGVISSYWKSPLQRWGSFFFISFVWGSSWFMANKMPFHFPESFQGVLLIVSGFLLAMFIHKPHKPVTCTGCKSQ